MSTSLEKTFQAFWYDFVRRGVAVGSLFRVARLGTPEPGPERPKFADPLVGRVGASVLSFSNKICLAKAHGDRSLATVGVCMRWAAVSPRRPVKFVSRVATDHTRAIKFTATQHFFW